MYAMDCVVKHVIYSNIGRSGYTYCIVKVCVDGTDKVDIVCGEIKGRSVHVHDHLVVRDPRREYNSKYSHHEYRTNFLMDIRFPTQEKYALKRMTENMKINAEHAKQLVRDHPTDPWKCLKDRKKPSGMDDYIWIESVLSKYEAFTSVKETNDTNKKQLLDWLESKGLGWGSSIAESIITHYKMMGMPDAVSQITTDPISLRHVKGIGIIKLKQLVSVLELSEDKKRELDVIFAIYDKQSTNGHIYFKHKEIPSIDDPCAFPEVLHVHPNTRQFCLKTQWMEEQKIATCLMEMSESGEAYDETIEMPIESNLSEEQQQAYIHAIKYPVSCITGVPGGGKSYVVSNVCQRWSEMYDGECTRVLLAPTGRAVYRLKELLPEDEHTICMTIHKFVYSNFRDMKKLDHMCVVVDECSMVDTSTFHMLLKFLTAHRTDRLLLVGDVNQLQPVGYGDVFRNILETGVFETTMLNKAFRQASGETALKRAILSVKDRQVPEVIVNDPSYERICAVENIEHVLLDVVRRYDPTAFERQDILILAPTNKTVLSFQQKLANIINPRRRSGDNTVQQQAFVLGDVVRHCGNVYNEDTVLLNGTPGVITGYNERTTEMRVSFHDRQEQQYSSANTATVELGYIGTVHKSQGSEANVVIIVLETYKSLVHNWSLMYTAITRAKEKCIIIGPNEVYTHIVTTKCIKRRTALSEHLRALSDDSRDDVSD